MALSVQQARGSARESDERDASFGGYRLGRRFGVLDAIRLADVSLAAYRRVVPDRVSSVLSRWGSAYDASFDEIVEARTWEPSAATPLLHDAAVRGWLHADVRLLLATFASLAETDRVRVRLRSVRTDACRKFHLDYVHMRLITTYVGPGTEWLPHQAARREVLEHPPECPCDANRAIVRDRRLVRRARAGDVLLMKGERHHHGIGLVHRSPPIETTGGMRLLLTLTTEED